MTKAAHLLTSLIFAIICAALWGAWWLGERYIENTFGDGTVSEFMRYALIVYPWLFAILPIPMIIYSAILMDRSELLVEKALLYFLLMILVSLVLIGASAAIFGLEWNNLVTQSLGSA